MRARWTKPWTARSLSPWSACICHCDRARIAQGLSEAGRLTNFKMWRLAATHTLANHQRWRRMWPPNESMPCRIELIATSAVAQQNATIARADPLSGA